MIQTKLKNTIALSLTGLGLVAGSANAATVLIDWSTGASVATPSAADGKYWNSLGAPGLGTTLTSTALIDVNNVASGFSVGVVNVSTAANEGAGFGGTGIGGPSGADPFDETNAVNDGIYANKNGSGISTITFTGLAFNTQYNFSAIGGRATTGTDGLISLLSGTSGFSSYDLLDDGTIANFSITSTAGGEISYSFSEKVTDTNNGNSATFKALSITQIPEPSVALLGGLGFLALLRRRR